METIREPIQDYIQLGHFLIIVRHGLLKYQYLEATDLFHGIDVNIAVASAITSCGRMWMSQVKNQTGFKLYYSDTDCVVISTKLNEALVGSELGKYKLEYEISRAVF